MEERLDKMLVRRGFASNRSRAEMLIRDGEVIVDGKQVTKCGKKVSNDVEIQLLKDEMPWVSRGAWKLLAAIDKWKPDLANCVALDIGASTGGFSEVLLQHNVQKVYAVDVGHGQLHPKIKADQRIINLEKTHVRDLTPTILPEQAEACVIDVSFISLEKVFPFLNPFLANDAIVIALVKPQFEVGKKALGKGGLVKDTSLFAEVLENVKKIGRDSHFHFVDVMDSPILGGDGNKEFLMFLRKHSDLMV
jgi:23S rRNA (cytidine1920-2'-O)/16S rRNA (cytidine1409-2'-O)-methyltransferase